MYKRQTLVQEKLSTYSGIARSDDFISGARAWLLHPVFGDGIGSLDAMSLVRPSWRKSAEGFNSGLMQLLVQGGIYLTLPYIVILMNGIRKSVKSRNYDRFIFVGLFCLIFAITVISFNYLTLMILLFLATDCKSYEERIYSCLLYTSSLIVLWNPFGIWI